MRTLLVSEEPVLNVAVGVNAAVAQERPVATHLFDPGQVDLRQHERFVLGGLGHDDAERIAHERMAPELDPGALATQPLETAAVHGGNPAAVRNRATALDGFPGVELLLAVFLLLRRMPTDRGRIQEYVGALQRRETRRLRVPLVPAHERADRTHLGVEGAKAQIPRREVESLVVRTVVWAVHLALDPFARDVRRGDRRR